MKKIIIIFIFLPFILFSQNKKSSFLIIYPANISTSENLNAEKTEYLDYEKNRSLESSNGNLNDKLKKEIEELTIEKIIGNVTLQSLQFYLYESFPKNKYSVAEKNTDSETKEKKKSDYLIEYNNLNISENKDGNLNLSFELVLFDIKKKEYLIKKEYVADEINQGGMWGCSESRFKCIINNTIRIGTAELAQKFWKE
ncbi:hypothetical protein MWU65_17165 [Cellulophaga sp. F20128]|uniref:hypothetical protein n=1 Tax=Cellulophaga sp. F20128 TaxID=2926413 RepID=UPI001FF3B44D|nr:hypothetical protein [Cellulophaga sp. F20128]MCK0158921.1 hypothetical protein [Cellulophaga sp. F20128]